MRCSAVCAIPMSTSLQHSSVCCALKSAGCTLNHMRTQTPPTKQTHCLTSEPIAPCPGEGMKAMSAVSAVRTLQLGCQCSGWWLEMDRQIFMPVWKRPLGVSIIKAGGLKGYSAGSRMRP